MKSRMVRAFNPDGLGPPRPNVSVSATTQMARPLWLTPGDFQTPLDLEIGCGVGWHPIRYALENPDRRLIAIEHTRAKFASFAHRLEGHTSLDNLWPVHADAIRWVTHFLPAESIDRCLLLYPNPEPKASNKRWLRSPFFHRLMETMKPQGEVWLVTNERTYFEEALQFAEQQWQLSLALTRELTSKNMPSPRTHFEKKYLTRGETCFEAHWRKS